MKKEWVNTMQNFITTKIYWIEVFTDLDKLNTYIENTHILNSWLMIVYIANSSKWYDWIGIVSQEVFEWQCNQHLISSRVIPKLINRKIIKKRDNNRYEIIK